MKRRLFILFSLVLLLMVSGCLRSKYPLSAVKDAKPDPRLVGRWKVTNPTSKQAKSKDAREEPEAVQIGFDEHGLGYAEGVFKDGRVTPLDTQQFFVTRTAKNSFINVQDTPHSKEYQLYRYQVSANGQTVRLWAFRQDPFDKAINAGRLKGKLNVTPSKKDGTIFGYTLLQTPSDQLLSFIESQPGKELYQELISAKKVR